MTVVTPVWNRRELLEPFFASLHAQTLAPQEVIVVDNGSTDGAAEEAEGRGARVVRMGSNRGFACAVNYGLREIRTELVAVVNNDVELAPDYFEQLAQAFDDRGTWFASGKILDAAARRRIDGTWDEVARSCCAWRAGHGKTDSPQFEKPRRVWAVPATAAVYRRSLFDEVGAFDETLESYLEDVEFSIRCALAGRGGWYEPRAVAWHHSSATLGAWHPDTVRRMARNQVWLAARYAGWSWCVIAGQALWGLSALRRGRFLAWLRGKAEGWRARPQRLASADALLSESEARILALQRATGWDPYWRLYFLLVRGVVK